MGLAAGRSLARGRDAGGSLEHLAVVPGTSGHGSGAVAAPCSALGTNLGLWALSLHLLHDFNPCVSSSAPSQPGLSLFQQLLLAAGDGASEPSPGWIPAGFRH